jgi:hypothetical protein
MSFISILKFEIEKKLIKNVMKYPATPIIASFNKRFLEIFFEAKPSIKLKGKMQIKKGINKETFSLNIF